jgi:alditol oxidase
MRTNWAGNVTFGAQRFHRPSSLRELQHLVARSDRVRALGTGHSFNRLADTPGDLVSVAALPRLIEIDSAHAAVTASAGLRYGELGEAVHHRSAVVRGLYGRLDDFRRLMHHYDPAGKLRNDLLDSYLPPVRRWERKS